MDLLGMALKRAGIRDHREGKLEVERVTLQFKDGKQVIILPVETKDYEGKTQTGTEFRVIGVFVKEWYDDGEQPPATGQVQPV